MLENINSFEGIPFLLLKHYLLFVSLQLSIYFCLG